MKNVLLISVDALPQELAYPTNAERSLTPNLDSIFSTGITCTNAYSVSFPTQFAMPGLLGGQLPLDFHGYHLGLHGRGDTIAQEFKKNGYRTIGITTDYHTSACYGYSQGFDDYIDLHDIAWHLNGFVRNDVTFLSQYRNLYQFNDCVSGRLIDQKLKLLIPFIEQRIESARRHGAIFPDQYAREIDSWNFDKLWAYIENDLRDYNKDPKKFRVSLLSGNVPLFRDIPNLRLAPHYPDANYVFTVAKQLLLKERHQPYFMWIHLTDVHGTLTQDLPGLRVGSDICQFREIDGDVGCFGRFPQNFEGEGERGHPQALSYVDSEIHRFWHWLNKSEFSSPILAFTADHGDYCNVRHGYGAQRGVTDHLNLYEELLHIPLRIVDPEKPIEAFTTFDGLVSSKDIGKILSDISLKGISSLHALKKHKNDFLIAEHAMPGTCIIPFKPLKIAITTPEYKLIWFDSPSYRFGPPRLLNLFNRMLDRYEKKDLSTMRSNECFDDALTIARDRAETIRKANPKPSFA